MSADAPDLAPRPTPGFFARLNGVVLRAALPRFFAFARVVRPIWRAGDVYVATRSDDVRQILLEPHLFATPYRQNLDIVVGDEPFFLAIDDPLAHDAATGALRKAVRPGDVATRLAPAIERAAADAVTAGKGRIEVVDALARRPVFEVFTAYLGVGAPAAGDGDLSTSAGLLFEFQFADDGSPWLHAQARARAAAARPDPAGDRRAARRRGRP
ncbi:hypothetical protein [Methylocella sp.]|uniref:hypothetical protein n=1 Tax=Methylocella sp. TaxID=1978226 RepID=UPI003783062D